MNRGDVYTVRFEPVEGSEQGGTRPAVIVSRSTLNQVRRTVVVVPITTNLTRKLSFHVPIAEGEGGLRADSVALGDQVRTVAKARLGRRWGQLSPASMLRIVDALRIALDL